MEKELTLLSGKKTDTLTEIVFDIVYLDFINKFNLILRVER